MYSIQNNNDAIFFTIFMAALLDFQDGCHIKSDFKQYISLYVVYDQILVSNHVVSESWKTVPF